MTMFEPLSGADGARIVPASGNLGVAGKQFWLGPDRAGVTVTFWADSQVIHLLIAGTRIKSLRSHLSTHDLELLARQWRPSRRPATPAAPPILTTARSRSTGP
jgi:hypothetical protein